MDSILNSAIEEICSHLNSGVSLQTLWSRLSSLDPNLDLSPKLKQTLWDSLRSIPTLNFRAKSTTTTTTLFNPTDPKFNSLLDAELLDLILVADPTLRHHFMGLYNVHSANSNISSVQRYTLERVTMARTNGITQTQLAKELGIEGKNFHYAVKNLECQGLLVRQSALLRTKEAGGGGGGDERSGNPSVTTNMLYSYRHAKQLGAQQKIEVTKGEKKNRDGFVNVEGSGDGVVVAGNVRVKDYLPAMKAVCDRLEEANGKVLVVSDIKKELGYSGSSGHRAWRNICQRLKAAQLVELFDANVDGKFESCLRFVGTYPTNTEPRTLVHIDEDFVEKQQVKFGKKCKVTDQLVELPIDNQIYEIIDAAGSEGLTRNEVMERLGLDNKKNYTRFVSMCSRFEMSLQPETHKKAVAYRFRTSGKQNPKSTNAFLGKLKDVDGSEISCLNGGNVDAPRSGQNQTGLMSHSSSLKSDAVGHDSMNNREITIDPSGSVGHIEFHRPGNSKELVLAPKDTTDSQVSSVSIGIETNGALSDTPAVLSKPLSKGSDPRYPCLSLTVENTRREKRILERLEGEKFILRAELYRWLVSLETDKCTSTDRKTIDRILQKLQQLGHCKCIDISVPIVTNLGRTRTTVVVLHPSIQSLTPVLVSEIHDAWRSFEIQSRGKCSSRWRERNRESVAILEDVQRTQNHGKERQTASAEAMRANGFILAKMVRAKLLHSFLWDYLYNSSCFNDTWSSREDEPHNSSKLFSLEETMKAIPVELFLQVAGSTNNFEDLIEKCKKGLCLSDLSIDEYKSLMDTHATGRLSLVIDILRRLKLIRMVCNHHSENGVQVSRAIDSAYALELKPYVEEPVSKDAISLNFGSLDLRPRIRHDFSLSNKEAVDEYWQTLEYCYAAADRRAALLAFPGSCVHEVSHHRSWTKLGVMTASQRDELLRRVVKDDPSEKLSFKECGKIAKDLNLTLEQVLRVYYNKRRQHLEWLQSNGNGVQSTKKRRRKRKRSSESRSVEITDNDEVIRQVDEQPHLTVSDTVEHLDELNFFVNSYVRDSHLQALDSCLDTEQEPEPNEEEQHCSLITRGSFSKLKPVRPSRRSNLHSARQRRFTWTEEADRQLIIQYARHRAMLGAKIHRINWASVPDLPSPPITCMKRMTSLKSNKRFRSALMRLCNILSKRYAKILEKTQNRSLNKDDCSSLLQDSTGQVNDSDLPSNTDNNPGMGFQEERWDNFDDNNIKKSFEEVLHHKRLGRFDASKRVGSTNEDWSDRNTNECDPQESESIASTAPYKDAQNHCGRENISAQTSSYKHLNEKYFKLLHGVDVNTQVYKSLAVSNAVELFKLVFLSTSTASEVSNLLAGILRRYSECDLFAAFNYLRDKKFMVGGNGSQSFSLSQQFLHNTSASPFPTNSGNRATEFAHWLQEKDKDLMEEGIDLSTDLQCGDIFHLFALISSGELSISPCLPDEGVGEAEESRTSKRKAEINELLDDEKTKKLKSFAAAEGEVISRREKGFPGIRVSVSRAEFPTTSSIDLFKEDTSNGEKHFGRNHQLESTSDQSIISYSDCMREIVPVLEISCESPWEGMVSYAKHLLPLHSDRDQSILIQPENFRAVYTAIQKAGDQGLSIEEISQIMNIPGENMTDLIIDVLQTFDRVLKVNAYDSIHVVDSLYRGKYFMTSAPGFHRKFEPLSLRKAVGSNGGHLKNRDNGATSAAISEREIDADVHKLTILNLPEEVDEPSYNKQICSVPKNYKDGKRGDYENDSSESPSGKLCMPIFPWINGDGTTNKIVYKGLTRRVLGIVMQNPAILEDEVVRRMDVLNPQSCRKLLELMVLDNHLHVRKMLQTTGTGPPPILGSQFGSSFKPSKLVCREHYFANPTSTSLL